MSIIGKILSILSHNILPQNRLGDIIYSFIAFVLIHKRLPGNKNKINDIWYKLKISKELLNPLRIFVSDKEFVKKYIKKKIGNKYNIKTFKILKNNNQIDSYKFPINCCIKPTQSSGLILFYTKRNFLDKKIIKSFLKDNYYLKSREVNYKSLKPKIIVEPIIFKNKSLNEFKFHCVNGIVKLIHVNIDRNKKSYRSYIFDKKWEKKNFKFINKNKVGKIPKKPKNLEKMINIAEKISKDFSSIRVDMYTNNKEILVGELTNVPSSAHEIFLPKNSEINFKRYLYN